MDVTAHVNTGPVSPGGSRRPSFVFAGGGTGGHLYPGLAIAQRLRSHVPACNIHFLCSSRTIDRTVLEPEGFAFTPLPAQPIALSPARFWRFVSRWPESVRQSRRVIVSLKKDGPVHVVAMGGFVAAPVVQAARVERVGVTLVNLDAVPGKANRWIARRCGGNTALTTVPDARYPTWRLVPPIVRDEAFAHGDKACCRRALGLPEHGSVLMITGGSQGATSINTMLTAFVRTHAPLLAGWRVLHQTGRGEVDGVAAAYRAAGVEADVVEFTRQMGLWWGAADLAVTRAGAGAVAEAWCNKVPCLFMPYPYHRDNHQKFNAAELVRRGAAVVADDLIDPEKNLSGAGGLLAELLRDGGTLEAMATAATRLPAGDGAEQIAQILMSRV